MKRFKWMAVLAAMALVLAACGDSSDSTTTAGDGDDGGDRPFDGEVVNIFGAFVDADAAAFDDTVAPFEEATGIDVVYEGSGDFETQIGIRVEGGNAPDIAMFPQPGLWAQFIEDMVDFEDLGVDVAAMAADNSPYLADLPAFIAELNDKAREGTFGGWFRLNTKSWLWVPVPEFEEAGYSAPATWDDLIALQEQILADGNTPWCFGMESGGATGWVATDWMEDIVLRTGGTDVYDQWVAHEIPFNDPEITDAAERLGQVMFPEGNVLGGTDAILATPFGDQNTPMFEDPPACYLAKQAGFITGFFPDGVFGPDVDNQAEAIPFPSINNDGDMMLGAGDLFGVFTDSGAVAATVNWLISPEGGEGFARAEAGFLSPNKQFDVTNYLDPFQQQQGKLLATSLGAGTFRFDASDLMPASVGAGTFWTGMVEYTQNGPDNLGEVLTDIDNSWP
jgi:alpha-glucoside transport system substrate-binding protein